MCAGKQDTSTFATSIIFPYLEGVRAGKTGSIILRAPLQDPRRRQMNINQLCVKQAAFVISQRNWARWFAETDDRDVMTLFIYLLYCGGMRWQRETGPGPDEGNVTLCYHPCQQQPTLLIYRVRHGMTQPDSSLGVVRLLAGFTKG